MTLRIGLFFLIAAFGLALAGCPNDSNNDDDAGVDAGQDAGEDGGQDAGDDAGIDAGDDGGADAGDDDTDGGDAGGDDSPACTLDADCAAGEVCVQGSCLPFVPECQQDADCVDPLVCRGGVCRAADQSPFLGALVFNELLTDGATDEDANGDGTINSMQDEFIELVNISSETIDLSGWTLSDTDWGTYLPRHTFEPGTSLAPMGAVVIFGGGDAPEPTATVLYFASNAQDPGTPYGLDLDDDGDRIDLADSDGLNVASFSYGDEGGATPTSDQSLTRAPDLSGDFSPHADVPEAGGAIFSPGTRLDASPF